METYSTDEERLEALQRWWKENKHSMLVGVVLGVGIISGWRMWESSQISSAEQASALYQQLVQATDAKQTDAATNLGERLLQQHASTIYADYARLHLAKLRADAQDLAGARKRLEEEVAQTRDDPLKLLATLRLGRVMLAQNDIEPALKMLEPMTDAVVGKFGGLYEELRGDLLTAANRPQDARAAYARAQALGNQSPVLELKLNDLPAAN